MQGNVNIPDSTITTNLSFRQLVLMNMQQLTNFPYIEKDFDALTDYELLCLVVKYLNDVIANQNEQNDSITRMYESFLALQTYVNNTKDTLEDAFNELDDYVRNYFDNLDVQQEINNKLDQMLEDGVLEQIIEQFLQSTAIWCFDTVADMKLATNLINGSYAKTLGYYAIGDGGESLYKITNVENTSIHQESFGSLYADLIINDFVKPEQLGAYGDETHDDTEIIQECITKYDKIYFAKNYMITEPLILKSNIELKGDNNNLLFKDEEDTGDYVMFYSSSENGVTNIKINGLHLKGNKYWTGSSLSSDENDIGIRIKNGDYITIENCSFEEFGGSAIDVVSDNLNIDNNNILYTGTFTGATPNYNFGISYEGSNCKITRNKISGVIQGIIAGLENEDVIISENNISTKGQHGIYIESGNKLNIVNNIVHDCELAGIKVQLNNVELQNVPYEDIIISNNNIKNCKAQGVLITNILEYATFKNFVVSSNIIKDCARGIDLEQMSSINVVNNYIETSSTKEYGIFINKCDNFNIVSNTLKLVNTPQTIYLQEDTTGTHYVNSSISNNILENTLSSVNANLLSVYNGKNLVISNNIMNFIGTTTLSDGLLFRNTSGNTVSIYAINNVINGSRWDIRALASTNITLQGNIYGTITGITQ